MGGVGGTAGTAGTATAGTGGTGTGGVPGGVPGTSCHGSGTGLDDCGPDGESCCTRPLVVGGAFYRNYDSVQFKDKSYPATVSDFRLDKYEITVGRFRNFISAWDAGWRPVVGAGKHAHLNDGNGLANSAPGLGYESGWRPQWSSRLPTTRDEWDSQLGGTIGQRTCPWSEDDSYDGRHPVECVDWYEAYAFCIWDGGFLPSGTEWDYAAAGGNDQRVYPWSSPPTSTDIDCSKAVYFPALDPCGGSAALVGSDSPAGDGRWGQSDLAGNVSELVLDGYSKLYGNCIDCAYTMPDDVYPSPTAVVRGFGDYFSDSYGLMISARRGIAPDKRQPGLGARCAYSP